MISNSNNGFSDLPKARNLVAPSPRKASSETLAYGFFFFPFASGFMLLPVKLMHVDGAVPY